MCNATKSGTMFKYVMPRLEGCLGDDDGTVQELAVLSWLRGCNGIGSQEFTRVFRCK